MSDVPLEGSTAVTNTEKGLRDYGPPDLYATAGKLLAGDLGKWIVDKSLDSPKQVIRVIHNENSTAIQWYRNPDAPDGISGMVTQHDYPVRLYSEKPVRDIIPPAVSDKAKAEAQRVMDMFPADNSHVLPPAEGSGYCPDGCTWPHDHRFERDGIPWPARGRVTPPTEKGEANV